MGDTGRAALTWSHASPGFGVGARGGSAETRHSGRVPACPALRGSLHSLCPCGAGGARGLSTRVLPGTLPEVHSCPCSGGAGREMARSPAPAQLCGDRQGLYGVEAGRTRADLGEVCCGAADGLSHTDIVTIGAHLLGLSAGLRRQRSPAIPCHHAVGAGVSC